MDVTMQVRGYAKNPFVLRFGNGCLVNNTIYQGRTSSALSQYVKEINLQSDHDWVSSEI